MKMKNALLCARPAVEHSSKITVPQFLHHTRGQQKHSTDQFGIFLRKIIQGRNLFFGNNQKVHRRLRLDVFDDDVPVILKNNLGRNLARYDFGEDRIFHESTGDDTSL